MKPHPWYCPCPKKMVALIITVIFLALIIPYITNTGPVIQEPVWSADYTLLGTITETFNYPNQGTEISYYFKMQCDNDTHIIKTSWGEYAKWRVNDTYRFWGEQIVRDPRPAPYKGDWYVVAHTTAPNTTVMDKIILFTVRHNRTTGVTGNLNFSVDFAMGRYDTSTAHTITVAEVYEIYGVTVDNITYDIIGKNPDGTYKVEWTDTENYTTNMRITAPPNPEERTAELRLNMTVDIRAIERMGDYQTITVHLKVAGVYFSVSVMMMPD